MFNTHTLKVASTTTQPLDIRGLGVGELYIQSTVAQFLLDKGQCAGVISIGERDLVQWF